MRAPFVILAVLSGLCASIPASAEDTCASCHHSAVDKAPHRAIDKAHPGVQCADCHRGLRGAKTASAAHAYGPAGAIGADAVLKGAAVASSCGQCHIPGAVKGTEPLVTGARAYLDLGCPLCHSMLGTRTFAAYAPPLDAIGLRGPAYVEKVVKHPAQVFPKTSMPGFEHYFMLRPDRGAALLLFLAGQRGAPRAKPKAMTDQRCVGCHVGGASKPTGAPHRCALLKDERSEFSCARCHAKQPPPADAAEECSYVERRSHECGVCHMPPGGPGGA